MSEINFRSVLVHRTVFVENETRQVYLFFQRAYARIRSMHDSFQPPQIVGQLEFVLLRMKRQNMYLFFKRAQIHYFTHCNSYYPGLYRINSSDQTGQKHFLLKLTTISDLYRHNHKILPHTIFLQALCMFFFQTFQKERKKNILFI